jgi:cation:H+ antiporter
MIENVLLFLVGFVVLIKGADFMVDGAASIAKKFGISSLVIGLTVVAFGTSAPELVVNIIASFQGSTDIAIGNILGSNIANTLLILGAAAIIYPITVKNDTVWKEIPFSLIAVIVLFFAANDMLLDGATQGQLSRSDGLMMISIFLIFMAYIAIVAKRGLLDKNPDHEHIKDRPTSLAMSMVLLGIIGLTLGGKWIVDGAVFFATKFGLSEALIGLTIVAVGTSLPELATAIVAAKKKHSDMVIGNVVGSNIFNILWVLAISSSIRPLPFSEELNQDIMVVLLVTFLLFVLMLWGGKKNRIEKWEGALFLTLYALYIGYLMFRG